MIMEGKIQLISNDKRKKISFGLKRLANSNLNSKKKRKTLTK